MVTPKRPTQTPPVAPEALAGERSAVERLRQGLREAELDCRCRARADAILERIGAEDDLATRAGALTDARKMRDAIVLVTTLLDELDSLQPDEPDRSAFSEIADLFDDIGDFAAHGAAAARLCARRRPRARPGLTQ
ncbi:hypothetical protein [Nitratireductor sp. StC3]|uniref:hypothetical protein n=1 Tax=Nitratireductor sp. StC3 TaxID=2126741 RepID=UPI000D0DB0B8|nr:hypothetical protein [Nitratireductor sp. StC3]PSM16877.1 hypothetical protein C7T96_17510 [Nitratireductor sp. StC3]